jgi:hypothetical protein
MQEPSGQFGAMPRLAAMPALRGRHSALARPEGGTAAAVCFNAHQ